MNFAETLHTKERLPLTHTTIDRQNNLWLCTHDAQYIYKIQSKQLIKIESSIQEEVFYIEQGKGNYYFNELLALYLVDVLCVVRT